MAADEELVQLFEKASKAADKASSEPAGGPEEARCVEAVKAMHSVPVTTALLISSQVGKRLRLLTKHSRPKIQKAAVDLLEVWKKTVATEAKNGCTESSVSSGGGSSKPPATVKLQKKTEKVVEVVQRKAEKVVDVKVESKVKVDLRYTETTKTTPSAKPVNLSSIPKTKEETRDKIRELLVEALARVCSETNGHDLVHVRSRDPVQVAVSVETVMFQNLGLSKGVNKMKYRSIMFNIRDMNNPDLRRRVLLGDISPEELINLPPEEMASDQRKLENLEIKKKALFECERGNNSQASTDQFKCGKCGQRKCTYYQMQTRSADEPMTTFVTCVNCNNRWKFC